MKVETDLGPLVSLLLYSLLLKSLRTISILRTSLIFRIDLPKDFVGELWIIILLGQNVEELRHRLRKMLEVGQILYYQGLRTLTSC